MKTSKLLKLKNNRLLTFLLIFIALFSCKSQEPKVYQADWDSLAAHEAAPEWFRDAKLGIYFHWGVYSVPAYASEWYPRLMYIEGNPANIHHKETYGDPSEFNYHDFVPMFKAENFDADEWANLFVKAGARFAGPVAEHHDGFSMWDSDVTPWNAADMGPKRDITGELEEAITDRGMKFITTFHHARNLQKFDSTNRNTNDVAYRSSHYPYIKGMATSSDDDILKYLYGNIPAEQWYREVWFGKLKEVIDKYQPDIIWFDSWLDKIPEEYRKEFSAYYLNAAEKWGKEVVIVRKQDDLPLDYTVDDLEKSRKNKLEPNPWMTDETISKGSWCYTQDLKIKPAVDVLHVLVDIVSKNGILLLNISPMANGTIPEDQRNVLLEMGAWLDKYGESIYETRPWYTYGEGPTREPEGSFKNHQQFLKVKYSWRDVRYTTKKQAIYAITLGWPEKETITFKAFANSQLPEDIKIKDVSLLGSAEKLKWEQTDEGLTVDVPGEITNEMAAVYKIITK